MKERTKEFLINLAVGAVIAAAVFALNLSREYTVLRCLCDGSFVAAVYLLGMGCIKFARNRGSFDVAGYGVRSVVDMAIPMLRREEKETMQQYRERKAQGRKPSGSMLLAGLVYLVLSVLLLAVFEMTGG